MTSMKKIDTVRHNWISNGGNRKSQNLKHLKLPHTVFHFQIDKLYLGELLKIAESQIELQIQ